MDAATRKTLYFGLIGLILAGSIIAVFQVKPIQLAILAKDGTVSVYMSSIQTDIPSKPGAADTSQSAGHISGRPTGTISSLNVTIDSVSVHGSDEGNDSWIPVSNTRFTLDILKPIDVSRLIAMGRIPEQNVTMVRLHVASATAAIEGVAGTQSVNVPSNDLKIPVSPAVRVKAQMTSSITISGTAHIVFQGNGAILLTPVLHVERTSGPQ